MINGIPDNAVDMTESGRVKVKARVEAEGEAMTETARLVQAMQEFEARFWDMRREFRVSPERWEKMASEAGTAPDGLGEVEFFGVKVRVSHLVPQDEIWLCRVGVTPEVKIKSIGAWENEGPLLSHGVQCH